MNAIKKAIEVVGSQEKLAAQLGIKQPTVSQWLRGDRPIPAERCPAIERATSGAVLCEDLRPDIEWHVLRGQTMAERIQMLDVSSAKKVKVIRGAA